MSCCSHVGRLVFVCPWDFSSARKSGSLCLWYSVFSLPRMKLFRVFVSFRSMREYQNGFKHSFSQLVGFIRGHKKQWQVKRFIFFSRINSRSTNTLTCQGIVRRSSFRNVNIYFIIICCCCNGDAPVIFSYSTAYLKFNMSFSWRRNPDASITVCERATIAATL